MDDITILTTLIVSYTIICIGINIYFSHKINKDIQRIDRELFDL